MRTLVVSDLHLGTPSGADVLRRASRWRRCSAALDGVDRLVLLGDMLELRQCPMRDAMAAAEPVMRGARRRRSGADGEVVIVPGNHDHRLIAPWFEQRGRDAPPPPLGARGAPGPRRLARAARARAVARARHDRRRLSRAVAARRRLRHPRPLPRPPHDAADVRAHRRRDHGPPGRRAARQRDARRLRGRARAALRVDGHAAPSARPTDARRRRAARSAPGAC